MSEKMKRKHYTDLSTNVCIEDCYIESGNDLVAVKKGWNHYGIAMARPSSNITMRRVSGTTPTYSGVGIGSEMSGGIFNARTKIDKGRGGNIENITIRYIKMERVKIPIRIGRGSNSHPDEGRDPKALPKIRGISFVNVVSVNTIKAPVRAGIIVLAPSVKWQSQFVSGFNSQVFPLPCPQLQNKTRFSWVTSYPFNSCLQNFPNFLRET
ncbi:hypothetical protein CISIN_1g036907mg [Citrus sinensis]|uniref:Uncharacterized protein n=1 Tax=Citrus sinensis TaxID=2711 RepID=A0A067D8K9_CITSI|nr:hypothetical protein CISIN_1g036907mg [Citrus sinensis]